MNIETLFNIKGKRIVITGANGYLGRAMARGLADVGADLILLSLSEKVKELGEELSCEAYAVNNYDEYMFCPLLRNIANNNEIHGLINNAYDMSHRTGFNAAFGELGATDRARAYWQAANDCMSWSVRTIEILGEQMRRAKHGSIVNISSMYSKVAPSPELYEGTDKLNPPTYGASKAALDAFTRYVASFWGEDGVRCNAVNPGAFPNLKDDDPFKERIEARCKQIPLGRPGRPEELIGILVFLLSDASSYVTGQCISVDGGWTIT